MKRTLKFQLQAVIAASMLVAVGRPVAAQDTIFFLERQIPPVGFPVYTDQVFRVDRSTGQSTFVGSTGEPLESLEFAADGRLFGITREDAEGAAQRLILLELDRDDATVVGEVVLEFGVGGMTSVLDLHCDRKGRFWLLTTFSTGGGPSSQERATEIDIQTGATLRSTELRSIGGSKAFGEDQDGFYGAAQVSGNLFLRRVDFETGVFGRVIPVEDKPVSVGLGGDADAIGRLFFLGAAGSPGSQTSRLLVVDTRDGGIQTLVEGLRVGAFSPAIQPPFRRTLDIPTTSQLGLGMLALILATFGLTALRRRHRIES